MMLNSVLTLIKGGKILMSKIHRVILNVIIGFVTFVAFCGSSFAKTDLLVYTAVEADELAMFKAEFESDYPRY